MLIKPDGAVSENRHPDKVEQRGDKQHGSYKFLDCPPPRNLGDKQANIWRPRYPPGPVQDGPVIKPGQHFFFIDVGVECQAEKIVDVTANPFRKTSDEVD